MRSLIRLLDPAGRLGQAGSIAGTALIGGAGGLVFFLLGLPLPWMLGAMGLTTAAALSGLRVEMPRRVRNVFVPILGITLAGFFDLTVLADPGHVLFPAMLVALYLLVTTWAGFHFYHRVAGYDAPTACLASVPGGLSEIILVAEPLKADVRAVALSHAARLVIVIPVVVVGLRMSYGILDMPSGSDASRLGLADAAKLGACAIAGFLLGRLVRLPAPQLFGPLLLGSVAYLTGWVEGAPPGWLVALAQVVLGVFIGVRFVGTRPRELIGIAKWSGVWVVFLLGIAASIGAVIAGLLGVPIRTAFLAFSPGGVAEISLLALASGADLDFVMTVQFLRIAMSLTLGPALMTYLFGDR